MVVYESWQQPGALGRRRPSRARWRLSCAICWACRVTTLVASAATTPFAAFHFQTIPTYGVLANLVAVPLTTFLVMPAGMIGLLLMPLGLEGPLFHAMGLGCEAVLRTARPLRRAARRLDPGAAVARRGPGPARRRRALAGAVATALALARPGAVAHGARARPASAGRRTCWSSPPSTSPRSGIADGEVMLIEGSRDRLVRDAWLRSLGVADADAAPKPGAGPERRGRLRRGGLRGRPRRDQGIARPSGRGRGRGLRLVATGDRPHRPGDCAHGALIGPRALRRSGGIAIRRRRGWPDRPDRRAMARRWPWSRGKPTEKVELIRYNL